MLKKISNIGDCGITCDFGDEVNKNTNKEVIKLFNFIQDSVNRRKIKGILNYTPSYNKFCLLYTSPSPRDRTRSRMPSSA